MSNAYREATWRETTQHQSLTSWASEWVSLCERACARACVCVLMGYVIECTLSQTPLPFPLSFSLCDTQDICGYCTANILHALHRRAKYHHLGGKMFLNHLKVLQKRGAKELLHFSPNAVEELVLWWWMNVTLKTKRSSSFENDEGFFRELFSSSDSLSLWHAHTSSRLLNKYISMSLF